jgi:hypothetical protein
MIMYKNVVIFVTFVVTFGLYLLRDSETFYKYSLRERKIFVILLGDIVRPSGHFHCHT